MQQITQPQKVYQCRGCKQRVHVTDYPAACRVCGSDSWQYLYTKNPVRNV